MDASITRGNFEHPIKGASSAFAIIFAICAILQIIQNTKYKTWRLLWLLPSTSILFAVGFICREINAFTHSAYPGSQGLLYSGVPLFLATLYLSLYHLIAKQPDLNLAHPWPSIIYSMIGILTGVFIPLTANGTSNYFNPTATPGAVSAGLAILKASLILLLLCNIVFFPVLSLCHYRYYHLSVFREEGDYGIKILAMTLYTAGVLVFVRNLYRTVQIFEPLSGHAWRTEAFFWIFDAVPLLVCEVLLGVNHPGRLIPLKAGNARNSV